MSALAYTAAFAAIALVLVFLYGKAREERGRVKESARRVQSQNDALETMQAAMARPRRRGPDLLRRMREAARAGSWSSVSASKSRDDGRDGDVRTGDARDGGVDG